ncbi:uncharacterized protein PHACADRAFT_33784, partial [Phanerochaete carnosa HHB-10118-sp]
METHCPELLPEIIRLIVSTAIASDIDGHIVSKAAVKSQTPNTVTSLLAASYRLRQATLDFLSEAFNLPLSREGIWQLEQMPWTKIDLVRQAYAWTIQSDSRQLDSIMATLKDMLPPVLKVYMNMRAIDILIDLSPFSNATSPINAKDFRALIECGDVIVRLIQLVKTQYENCSPVFLDILLLRLNTCLGQGDICVAYNVAFRSIACCWSGLKLDAYDANGAVVDLLLNAIMQKLGGMLHQILQEYDLMLQNWPYTHPLDVMIGVER